MIDELKPYPEYKASGLSWLDQLPVSWSATRTKNRFRLRIEKSGRNHGMELLSVYTHIGVRPRKDLEERGNKASSTNDYWVVRKGDIVVNKLLAWMGAVGVSNYDGVTSPAYDILRPLQKHEPIYYHHLFRTPLYLQLFKSRSRGIMDMRLRLYFDELGQIPLLCPPPDEQAAIVKFLDYANGKIERAIRAKRKLIGLLNEQKQAIIHRAVTRGLDPNVKLKPSGIPWLGDVPEHWEIDRLKHFVQINPSKSEIPIAVNNKCVSFLPMERVSVDGHISKTETIQVGLARNGFTYMRDGDVIVAKITPCFENGKGALCTALEGGIAFGSTEFHVLRPVSKISGGYLYFLTRDPVLRQLGAESMQGSAGQQRVPKDFFANIQVTLPSLSEQKKILDEINATLDKLNLGISSTEREIDLLREYRTTLTAEVVTGKLDVREAAKRLPDHAVETLPPDDSMDELIEDEIDQEDDA